MISGDRMEKRPLTPQPESFAVWHRLLQNSLASPFVSGLSWLSFSPSRFFAPDRRTSHVRFGLLPGSKLPTPARLNEVSDPEPPWTGLRSLNK